MPIGFALRRDLHTDFWAMLQDHELLYDQAVNEYEKGHLEEALALFEKAHVVSRGHDARVSRSMAAVKHELGVQSSFV